MRALQIYKILLCTHNKFVNFSQFFYLLCRCESSLDFVIIYPVCFRMIAVQVVLVFSEALNFSSFG